MTAMVPCPCGHLIRISAKFCEECGTPNKIVCSCGNSLAATAKFCSECGAVGPANQKAPAAAPAPAPAPAAAPAASAAPRFSPTTRSTSTLGSPSKASSRPSASASNPTASNSASASKTSTATTTATTTSKTTASSPLARGASSRASGTGPTNTTSTTTTTTTTSSSSKSSGPNAPITTSSSSTTTKTTTTNSTPPPAASTTTTAATAKTTPTTNTAPAAAASPPPRGSTSGKPKPEGQSLKPSRTSSKVDDSGRTKVKNCEECGKALKDTQAYMQEGIDKVLCQECLGECLCVVCGEDIEGAFFSTSDGSYYHQTCFVCTFCSAQLEETFNTHQGKLCCKACHQKLKPKKICEACQQDISGKHLALSGKLYHEACLKCGTCGKPTGAKVRVRKDGSFMCEDCVPACYGCGKKFEGSQQVTAAGKSFHADCFKCTRCATLLGKRFTPKDGEFLCSPCFAEDYKRTHEEEEKARVRAERALQKKNTENFSLFWRQELTPSSVECLRALGVPSAKLPPSEKVCLQLDVQTGAVKCAPTRNDEASINLSYLVCAIQVLAKYGSAAKFSLDPADPQNLSGEEQVKVFFPDWLENTVYGEVLFQADYFLKEVCFGNVALDDIPGLVSAFEAGLKAIDDDKDHAARQWFIVNAASMDVALDGVLIPRLSMAVEARKLIATAKGYVDAPTSDPSDPSVAMARAVSENFARLAARVPVVAELVEVAKAQLMARYLMEQNIVKINKTALDAYTMPVVRQARRAKRIPTLKKTRTFAHVEEEDDGGAVSTTTTTHTMHGGVDLSYKARKVPSADIRRNGLDPALGGEKALVPIPLFLAAAALAA